MTTAAKAGTRKAADDALIEALGVDELADVFKAAGYRVTPAEQNGMVQLMSASQGVGFAVRFGNPGNEPGTFLDFTLSCALQVQGELPAEIIASWNRTKRFARLWEQGQFLVLEMDVVVAGGVSDRNLRSLIELWDSLIREFLLHLRNRPAMAAAAASAVAAPELSLVADAQAPQVTTQ
jgi:Putative bacterial sensory transduction regulator